MEPGEYEELVGRASTGGYAATTELLQVMRTHKIRQPELVLLHGAKLVKNSPGKLGNELWTVLEQVFMAACEMGHDGWRDYCLKKLMEQFPSSNRVERLKGMRAESAREWSTAKGIYQEILKEKPEDTIARKRLIAIHKQCGKTAEAIEEINKYLDSFCVDAEVWHELAELYIEAGSLSRAVFCFEELMMVNPRSIYHILAYAELLYSTGDFELSRKYFSLAAYLDGSCLRALWGLYACNLAQMGKEKNPERMEELQKQTLRQLKAAYQDVKGSHGKVAIALLMSEDQ